MIYGSTIYTTVQYIQMYNVHTVYNIIITRGFVHKSTRERVRKSGKAKKMKKMKRMKRSMKKR